jgi:hypothetical protein
MIHMNLKYVLALFGVLLFGAGIVMAISGADVTQVSSYRWTGLTAGNLTTEGGNITNANVNGTSLTDRWAAFWGDVTGAIVLGNRTTYVYQWAWNPASDAGEVCLSTASAYNFVNASAAAAADIDTAWSFTSGADQAADTFSGTCSALNFVHTSVAAPIKITHHSPSTFMTCGIRTEAAGTAKANFAFCTAIQNTSTGLNYNNAAANYEIMVPTADGTASPSATETYYFYAELN